LKEKLKKKTFHDKQKLKQFLATIPTMQKIFKRILHTEKEDKQPQKYRKK
jgi:hypothetical protein